MSWSNYRWAWHVRGVNTSEQLVLLYLGDQANGDGEIAKLSVGKISRTVNLDQRQVRRIMADLTEMAFIVAKRTRFAPKGNQISNAYRLDLRRRHPPDKTGAGLWRKTIREIQAEKLISLPKLEVYVDGATAYYERGILTVWLTSPAAARALQEHAFQLRSKFREHDPPVNRYEFLAPP